MNTYRVIVSYRVTHVMYVNAESKEEAEKTAIKYFPLEDDLDDDVIDDIEGAKAEGTVDYDQYDQDEQNDQE